MDLVSPYPTAAALVQQVHAPKLHIQIMKTTREGRVVFGENVNAKEKSRNNDPGTVKALRYVVGKGHHLNFL